MTISVLLADDEAMVREGLRLVLEEGLENRWARHLRNHKVSVQVLVLPRHTDLTIPILR